MTEAGVIGWTFKHADFFAHLRISYTPPDNRPTGNLPAVHQAARVHSITLERAMDVRHLNQVQLSRRWSISPRTLERWRWLKAGPQYLKIGGRVVYRLAGVRSFEGGATEKQHRQ